MEKEKLYFVPTIMLSLLTDPEMLSIT